MGCYTGIVWRYGAISAMYEIIGECGELKCP